MWREMNELWCTIFCISHMHAHCVNPLAVELKCSWITKQIANKQRSLLSRLFVFFFCSWTIFCLIQIECCSNLVISFCLFFGRGGNPVKYFSRLTDRLCDLFLNSSSHWTFVSLNEPFTNLDDFFFPVIEFGKNSAATLRHVTEAYFVTGSGEHDGDRKWRG